MSTQVLPNIEASEDFSMDSGAQTTNNGTATTMACGNAAGDPVPADHAFLKFDVQQVAAFGVTITGAEIGMYCDSRIGSGDISFSIYVMAAANIQEATATWLLSNGGSWATPGALGSADRGPSGVDLGGYPSVGAFTVGGVTLGAAIHAIARHGTATPIWLGFYPAGDPNESFVIRTSEHGTVADRPKLRLTVTIPDHIIADTLVFTASPTEITQLRHLGTISGVAIIHAGSRNGAGTGFIRSTGDGTLLSWKAPGSSVWGPSIPATADGGTVRLVDGSDPSKFVRCLVRTAHLLAIPTAHSVLLFDSWDNGVGPTYPNFTSSHASAGHNIVKSVNVENLSPSAVHDIKFWIDSSVSHTLEISLSSGGGFVSPTTEAAALAFGDLQPGQARTLYIKTTIPASSANDPEVLNLIQGSFRSF